MLENPLARNANDGSSVTGQRYEYDEANRVSAVRRHSNGDLLAEYKYDALGRRVETIEYVDPTASLWWDHPRRTRHVYVGIEVVEEYVCGPNDAACCGSEIQYCVPTAAFTLAREFVWGDPGRFPEPVAMIDHTGAGTPDPPAPGPWVYHYLHDVLGSVVGLTDSTGALVERYTYDPYGKSLMEHAVTGRLTTSQRWAPQTQPVFL